MFVHTVHATGGGKPSDPAAQTSDLVWPMLLEHFGPLKPEELVATIAARTEKVSAAFIKELMRRSVQFLLERDEAGKIELADVDSALNEMLFSGGSLNLKLLGGAMPSQSSVLISHAGQSPLLKPHVVATFRR